MIVIIMEELQVYIIRNIEFDLEYELLIEHLQKYANPYEVVTIVACVKDQNKQSKLL